jgi:hypothetical protein
LINFFYCRNIITNSSAFVWSETQVNLLISLLTKVTKKRALRLSGESLPEPDVKDLTLRGEYLRYIDSIMYPRDEEDGMGVGNFWFNYWSPTDNEFAGRFRNDNWAFFAKQFHSISFDDKIELNIKFLSRQEQGQEITTEKTINLLTDKGKI